jgi:hypothetical protein
MGKELLDTNATFRESIKICASVVEPFGLDLLGAFQADNGFGEPRTAAVGLASVQVWSHSPLRSLFNCALASHCLWMADEQKNEAD